MASFRQRCLRTAAEIGRCERIRTSDPFHPKEVRYQAALRTDVCENTENGGANVTRWMPAFAGMTAALTSGRAA
jgi:hypothetical protein